MLSITHCPYNQGFNMELAAFFGTLSYSFGFSSVAFRTYGEFVAIFRERAGASGTERSHEIFRH